MYNKIFIKISSYIKWIKMNKWMIQIQHLNKLNIKQFKKNLDFNV